MAALEPRILNLADLSDTEVEMLKLVPGAKFNADGKTASIPDDDKGEPKELTAADMVAGIRAKGAAPPPESIAKRLAEGFEPPAGSMIVEEDGKVLAATANPPPKVEERKRVMATEADLADYVRGMLGGKAFTKSFELMGGNAKVTIRERTAEEDEDVIRRAATIASQQGQIENPVVLTLLLTKYRLAYCLESLTLGMETRGFPKIAVGAMIGEKTTLRYAVDDRVKELGDLPGVLYSVIVYAMTEFSDVTADIARRANDPKSWQTPSAV